MNKYKFGINDLKLTIQTKFNIFDILLNELESSDIVRKDRYIQKSNKHFFTFGNSNKLFISLKLSNISDCTIAFHNRLQFDTYKIDDSSTKKQIQTFNDYKDMYNDEDTIGIKYNYMIKLLQLIKKYNLFSETKIKQMSFSVICNSYQSLKLLQIRSQAKDKKIIKNIFDINSNITQYTAPFEYYKDYLVTSTTIKPKISIVHEPIINESIHTIPDNLKAIGYVPNIALSNTQLTPPPCPIIDEELTYETFFRNKNYSNKNDEILDLQKLVNDKLQTQFKKHIVKDDGTGSYYLYVDKDSFETYSDKAKFKVFDKKLHFRPDIDKNAKFITLKYIPKKTYYFEYNKTNAKKIYTYLEDKSIVNYNIKHWITTQKSILNKYNISTKYAFTLDSDLKDITKYIIDFTKSYMLINDIEKQIDIDFNCVSKLKLEQYLKDHNIEIININDTIVNLMDKMFKDIED